jgi:hypothetical protein
MRRIVFLFAFLGLGAAPAALPPVTAGVCPERDSASGSGRGRTARSTSGLLLQDRDLDAYHGTSRPPPSLPRSGGRSLQVRC